MEKRTFLKTGFFLGLAAASVSLLDACKTAAKSSAAAAPIIPPPKMKRTGPFTLPPLGYDPGALEPHIDKMTMEPERSGQGYALCRV